MGVTKNTHKNSVGNFNTDESFSNTGNLNTQNSQNTSIPNILNSEPTNDIKRISTKENIFAKYAPTINIDLHTTPVKEMSTNNSKESSNNLNTSGILPVYNLKQPMRKSKGNNRKTSPSDKNATIGSFNTISGTSTNKIELKNQTRNKYLKLSSPSTLKSTVESKLDKRNYRYNSNSYSTSFCQALTSIGPTNTIETIPIQTNYNNPYSNYKNSGLKSSRESNNKLKNLTSFYNSNSSSNKNESESQLDESERNMNNNPVKATEKFIDIFAKIQKIMNKTLKDSDQLISSLKGTNNIRDKPKEQLDYALSKNMLFFEIENLQNEASELHVNIKRYNMGMLNSVDNDEQEENYESTKFNTNIIKISSEKEDRQYTKNSLRFVLEVLKIFQICC